MGKRQMRLSRRRVLKSLAATSAAATSPGVFMPAIAQAGPLKIGILAPRTGIAASAGISGLRATEWAVEKFNAGGGIGIASRLPATPKRHDGTYGQFNGANLA